MHLYERLCLVRCFERAATEAMDRGEVYGAIHLSIGQEAVAVGVCANLKPTDMITSTHRGHHHVLAKGADPGRMMAELYGRSTGTCRGRGGSMHIADFSMGVLGANGVVAGSLAIAVGAAQGLRLRGKDAVVVCFFGDGATNRGPFLEALNWAQLFGLPVLFVCEDNCYAAYTRGASMIAGPGPVARAHALGIVTRQVEGDDALGIDAEARDCVAECRAGQGPRFLHVRTYRLEGHTLGDDNAYRSSAEVAAQWTRDPIATLRRTLLGLGAAPGALDRIEQAAHERIAEAVDFARTSAWPLPSEALEDVQEIGAPRWQE